jgi:hypothetical protein
MIVERGGFEGTGSSVYRPRIPRPWSPAWKGGGRIGRLLARLGLSAAVFDRLNSEQELLLI